MDNIYKSENVTAAPIRVIQLLYNAGVSLFYYIDEASFRSFYPYETHLKENVSIALSHKH